MRVAAQCPSLLEPHGPGLVVGKGYWAELHSLGHWGPLGHCPWPQSCSCLLTAQPLYLGSAQTAC